MSPEALRRRALAVGGELSVGGATVNSSRKQLRVVAKLPDRAEPAAAPAEPVAAATPPAATAGVTIEQVVMLLEAQNAQWRTQFNALADRTQQVLTELAKQDRRPRGHSVTFKTDTAGQIVGADITPKSQP